jgi:hypothetical protein
MKASAIADYEDKFDKRRGHNPFDEEEMGDDGDSFDDPFGHDGAEDDFDNERDDGDGERARLARVRPEECIVQ